MKKYLDSEDHVWIEVRAGWFTPARMWNEEGVQAGTWSREWLTKNYGELQPVAWSYQAATPAFVLPNLDENGKLQPTDGGGPFTAADAKLAEQHADENRRLVWRSAPGRRARLREVGASWLQAMAEGKTTNEWMSGLSSDDTILWEGRGWDFLAALGVKQPESTE